MSSFLLYFESDNTYGMRKKSQINKIVRIGNDDFAQMGYGQQILTGQVVCSGSEEDIFKFMIQNKLTPSCNEENKENQTHESACEFCLNLLNFFK
jgi:hypothetical protein